MTADSASAAPSGSLHPASSAKIRPAPSHRSWLVPATLVLLWAYAVYRLGTLWCSYPDYRFGWFVPTLSLALFWERWKCRPEPDASRPANGTFLLLAACSLAMAVAALFLEIIPRWRYAGWVFGGAVVTITITGFYLWGGRRWARHFLFPALFFLIAVPWPTRLEGPLINKLSHLNAAASVHAANLLGTPAVRHGVLIETGPGLVGVDNACSGIRSFQASVMVALFLGELFQYSFSRRLFLLLGGVSLAFICNVVRTTYLVCVCDLHGLAAVNLQHDEAGFTILGVTFAGLLALAWMLRTRKSKISSAASSADTRAKTPTAGPESRPDDNFENATPPPDGRGAPLAATLFLGVAVWIVIFEIGMEWWFRAAENRTDRQITWSFHLPARNLEFSEMAISDTTRGILHYDEGEAAQWRDIAGRPWQVYYLRWLPAMNLYHATLDSSAARGHSPDLCLSLGGMILETNLGTKTFDLNGTRLRVGVERFNDQGRTFHVASCYWEPVLGSEPPGHASTFLAFRTVWDAVKNHDRGRFEQRVIKIGVWDMETDAAAELAFQECLRDAISP